MSEENAEELTSERPGQVLPVETTIQEVTVYTDQAQVTRRGKIRLAGNERELSVVGLPMAAQTESVRAIGTGTVAVKLLGVRTERTVAVEPVSPRVAELTGQIEAVEERRRALSDRMAALTLQQNFVQGLSEKAVERFSQTLARQQISLEDTARLLDFMGRQYNDYATAISEGEKERIALEKELKALRRQLDLLATPRSTESYRFLVGIEPAGPGEFELEVSYLVYGASWKPLYDLRLAQTLASLNLTYLAEVQQSSGEDWTGVGLTLSTAKPGLGSLPPRLDPWYIDIFRPMPPPRVAAPMMQRTTKMADNGPELTMGAGAVAYSMAAAPPQPEYRAETATAEVSNEGGVVTFRLDRDSDIPGDGTPHKTTIYSEDFPARTDYVAMPRQVSFAYLRTTVTNSATGATLLPGQANIFRDNMFVGSTRLENIAPGQEFKLDLGIDEGLKIERDLVEREVDKKFIGGQRRVTYAYRLVVTNLRETQAELKLTEQLPVSRHESIKVRLNRTNPGVQPTDLGLLEWAVSLPSHARRELYYQFVVEYPAEVNLSGLNI